MSPLFQGVRSFLRELKRRKVYRVSVAYLAVAFVSLQAVSLLVPSTTLPGWTDEFLLALAIAGFPIAVVLAWAFELTPDGVRRQPGSEILSGPDAPSVGTAARRRPAWAGIGVILLVVGLVLLYPREYPSLAPRDWIVVASCDNHTDQEVLDVTLRAALGIALHQSSYLNVFPDSRIRETLGRMGREWPGRLDAAAAREVAQRTNLRAVLGCDVAQLGQHYTITARLMEPETGETMATFEVAASNRTEILGALEKLSRQIRKFAGESLAEGDSQDVPLPQATTTSLEALKNYAEARRAENEGRPEEQEALLQAAVELDSTFALAHAALGAFYYWENDRPRGERHFQMALAHADRISERERLWIRAQVPAFRGEREEAVHRYRAYLRRWSDDKAVRANLGHALLMLDRCSESIEAYRQVLELDPDDAAAHLNIATCQNKQNRLQDALTSYGRAFELQPAYRTTGNLNHEFGAVYVQLGRYAEGRAVFREMLDTGETGKEARGHRSLGLLEARRGALDKAAEHLRRAALLNRTAGQTLGEIRDRLFLASVHQLRGDGAAVDAELATVGNLRQAASLEPFFLQVEGRLRARRGDTPGARRLLALASELANPENPSDQASVNLLTGEIALASGSLGEGLQHLELAHAYLPTLLTLEALARIHRERGDLEAAIARYEEMVEEPEWGWEAAEHWVQAHCELGELYEALGQPDEAAGYYERFLDLWEAADPGLPVVASARARLAALNRKG